MADYTQPDVVQKRVRFFDGQFLQDQDFIDEQRYHLDRERRQSKLLRVTGIIEGLTVTSSAANRVTVARGVAVDDLGRQLILAADLTVQLTSKFAKQQNIELRLVYQETPTDVAQTGGKSARRWDESPKIAALAPDGTVAVAPDGASSTWDGPTVLLARLAVADNGAVTIDPTAARQAGLSVPGAVGIGTTNPAAKLEVTGDLKASDIYATGKVGIGTTGPRWKLSVSSSKEHLALYRELTETTGGNYVFLELAQLDNYPAGVPEVFPSIRFTHQNRFAHRIEGRESGFHFKVGWERSDDYSDIQAGKVTAGNLQVNGRVGINTTDSSWMLSVNATRRHLSLCREPDHTISQGALVFLELAQIDNSPPSFREVFPSIQFAHYNRFAHRIEGRGSGFHFKTGDLTKDDYSDIHAGNVTVTRNLEVVGNVGFGPSDPNYALSTEQVVEIRGYRSANLSLRTTDKPGAVDSCVMASTEAMYGAPRGMIVGTTSKIGDLSFVTNATTQLSITSEGRIGIGTTRPSYRLQVEGATWLRGDLFVEGRLAYYWSADKQWKIVQPTGNTADTRDGPRIPQPSDYRLKTGIRPIRNALDKVARLAGIDFRWNEIGLEHLTRDIATSFSAGPGATEKENQELWDKERGKAVDALSGQHLGLVAQDVESVVPEVVYEDSNGYKHIHYAQLTALLIEAVKEQQAAIEQLRGRLTTLEPATA